MLAGLAATAIPTCLHAQSAGWLCATDLPANLPRFQQQGAVDGLPTLSTDPAPNMSKLSEQGVAYSNHRWLAADGLPSTGSRIILGVGFVNNPSSDWRQAVQSRAMLWLNDPNLASRIAFDFTVPVERAHIRISQTGIGTGGPYETPSNKSLIGRLASSTRLEDGASTMYLYNIEATEHEFGHALALGHEHQHEALPSDIDLEKAVEYFREHQKWSREATIRNVIERRPSCLGDLSFNPASVMLYPLPPEIFVRPTVQYFNSNSIHERDRLCLRAIYGVG